MCLLFAYIKLTFLSRLLDPLYTLLYGLTFRQLINLYFITIKISMEVITHPWIYAYTLKLPLDNRYWLYRTDTYNWFSQDNTVSTLFHCYHSRTRMIEWVVVSRLYSIKLTFIKRLFGHSNLIDRLRPSGYYHRSVRPRHSTSLYRPKHSRLSFHTLSYVRPHLVPKYLLVYWIRSLRHLLNEA
jgi:hypothetical protein